MPSSPHSAIPPTPLIVASNLDETAQSHVDILSAASRGQASRDTQQLQHATTGTPTSAATEAQVEREYVSKVGILASSIPFYHNQYMRQREKNLQHGGSQAEGQDDDGEPLEPHEQAQITKLSLDESPREQSLEEQEATAKRLKPHSRSTVQLQNITAHAPELNTTGSHHMSPRRKKDTKWQFGIRSRNQPLEAMMTIYKALTAMGAEWAVPPPGSPKQRNPGPYPVNVAGATYIPSATARLSDSPEKDRGQTDPSQLDAPPTGHQNNAGSFPDDSEDDENIDPNHLPPGYLPKDPWVINVRWRKDGMYPPGALHPSSAHSSRIDLHSPTDEVTKRRSSLMGGSALSSATGSTVSVGASLDKIQLSTAMNSAPPPDAACYVYMDVQLYTIEPDTYLVDFKCSGYETMIEMAVSESEKKLVGSGYRVIDKDVTSPQPYLDLTNKLVIHLARGG